MTTAIALKEDGTIKLGIDKTLTNYKHFGNDVDKFVISFNYIFLIAGPQYVKPLLYSYLQNKEDIYKKDMDQVCELWSNFLMSPEYQHACKSTTVDTTVIICNGEDLVIAQGNHTILPVKTSPNMEGVPSLFCAIGSGAEFVEGAYAMNSLQETPLRSDKLMTELLNIASYYDPATGDIGDSDGNYYTYFEMKDNGWEIKHG